MTNTTVAPAGHSAEVEWHSGGPGKSAYSDYRWQCACGNRYDEILGDGVNPRHYAHLAEVAELAQKPAEAASWEAFYAIGTA